MAAARSATALRRERNSFNVMPYTIADANGDSNSEFTNSACYYNMPAMAGKHELTPQAILLKTLVDDTGGPRAFVDKFRNDQADRPNDPTYVSQIINGHRAFRDVARRNMAVRAGLPPDYFEKVTAVEQPAKTYNFETEIIDEAIGIMRSLPRPAQLEALGAIKLIAAQHDQNSKQRVGQ